MSVQSNFVYSETLPLTQSHLKELADPFEANFNRTIARVIAFLGGVYFNKGLAGVMFADAYIDHEKGKAIRSRIDQLNMAARDPKANPNVFIQREICSSILTYTDRSKTIKAVSTLAGLVSHLFLKHALRNVQIVPLYNGLTYDNIDTTSAVASIVFDLINIGAFCYSVVRRYTEGSRLQADNMQLASRLSYTKRTEI